MKRREGVGQAPCGALGGVMRGRALTKAFLPGLLGSFVHLALALSGPAAVPEVLPLQIFEGSLRSQAQPHPAVHIGVYLPEPLRAGEPACLVVLLYAAPEGVGKGEWAGSEPIRPFPRPAGREREEADGRASPEEVTIACGVVGLGVRQDIAKAPSGVLPAGYYLPHGGGSPIVQGSVEWGPLGSEFAVDDEVLWRPLLPLLPLGTEGGYYETNPRIRGVREARSAEASVTGLDRPGAWGTDGLVLSHPYYHGTREAALNAVLSAVEWPASASEGRDRLWSENGDGDEYSRSVVAFLSDEAISDDVQARAARWVEAFREAQMPPLAGKSSTGLGFCAGAYGVKIAFPLEFLTVEQAIEWVSDRSQRQRASGLLGSASDAAALDVLV
mgnify:CR=1 FL=1